MGLVRDGETIGERIFDDSRHHNELLTPTTVELLTECGVEFSDLDAIVVGCGPGPFTGLRVGMATAVAFGDALGIPVHGVCTLDAIARHTTGCAFVAIDARRKEVYYARYRDGVRVAGPEIMKPGAIELGEGEQLFIPEKLADTLSDEVRQHAIFGLRPVPEALVACADFSATPGPLEPLYLRRPDAKQPAARPMSPAIPEVVI